MENKELVATFEKINVEAAGIIQFIQSGKDCITIEAEHDIKCSIVGNQLKIMGKAQNTSVCNVNGQSYVGNNMSIINGVVYIDGTKPQKEIEHDPTLSKSWKISAIPCVKKISLTGSAQLHMCSTMLNKSLECSVTGSGNVDIPEMQFISLRANVTGSGEIDFNDSIADEVIVNVTGSGGVCEFIGTKLIEVTLTGSGDIKGSATKECAVEKEKIGSGSIKIKTEK